MNLTKSLYTRAIQCPKALWLKKYKPSVLTPPSPALKARFEVGNIVGDLACDLFPGGREVPYDASNFDGMIAQTRAWIDEGVREIYEATFSYGGILVMVDILRITEDGVELYEVKSATSVKEIYHHDLSIQYYVLKKLGFTVKSASIIHIDNTYVMSDELVLDQLFRIVDITPQIEALQEAIPAHLELFERYLAYPENEPDIDIGRYCTSPYECDAKAYCWSVQRSIPEYSVYNIFKFGTPKQQELTALGIVRIEDIPDDFTMTLEQAQKVQNYKSNQSHIDRDKIAAFLDTLSFPIYHLDFEAFQQPIPQWKGVRPFEQIPFQYSLHIEHADGHLEHREFLAEAGGDPRAHLAKCLVADIPTDVTVLAYNMSFEKLVIKKLAQQFPFYHDHLMKILPNVKDLMRPFQKGYYASPLMRGSYSIKVVLPALVPEMAKAYKELDLVHDGSEAMHAFIKLSQMEEDEKETTRKALLAYCKLDTLAMVEILKKLREVVR